MSRLYPLVNSMILSWDRALVVLLVYARTRPPAPSLIPPKYLITIAKILFKLLFSNTLRIGKPAVPDGSPSSDDFFISFRM